MDQRRPNPQPNKQGMPPVQWASWIWFVLMTLAMVWFWQEGPGRWACRRLHTANSKNISHDGEVTECSVQQTEIAGKIQPKPTPISKQAEPSRRFGSESAAPATAPETKTKSEAAAEAKVTKPGAGSETKTVPETASEAKKGPEVSNESTTSSERKAEENQPAAEKAFAFRTVRVDDPDLVRDLEKAGVKFTGVAPGFMSEFLWAWILPIGLMVLLWVFLSRRMGGMGQSVMSFGSSRAKLVAEKDIRGRFRRCGGLRGSQVRTAGSGDVPESIPTRYQSLGAKNPEGSLAGRPAWHGQDAAGARGGGRSESTVLLDQWK